MSTSTRQLSAIMFTDIVGYTTLMGENEQKAMELVRVNRELQQPLVEKHGGKWLKEMGDGTLCRFDSALSAVNCALDIQRSARADFDGKLRVGIHLGDITIEGGEIYGDGVNIASRVESIADPGGIFVTEAVHKAIRGSNVQSQFLGEMELKNVTYPVKVYTLQGPGLPAPEVQKKELKGKFWAELGRRNVFRAALVYVIAALLLLQLGKTLLPVLNISPSSITILAILIIAGFPIAIFLAWNYERSPEGFVRTTSRESWQNPLKSSQRKPLTGNIIIAGMALIIVVMYVYPRYLANPVEDAGAGDEIRIVDKSIAVLPFKNLSADEENQYFADGQMEAILNHLAKIKDLRVISRNTMEMYRESNKSTPTIASEVGVSYILEGSVQRYAEKVRITVQLIEGNTDQHLWSDNYDRDLTDIFAIQTEIAISVAQELRATITSIEQTIIESVPTSDLMAYDYYLKGMDYLNRSYAEEDFRYAVQMFERAVEIDPNYTLAWVGLASVSRFIYWHHYDRSEEHLAQTKQYLDRAVALDP